MKTVFLPVTRACEPDCRPHTLQTRSMKSVAMQSVSISLLALGVAFGACAQTQKIEPEPDPGSDFLEGVVIDPPAETQAGAPDAGDNGVSGGSPPQQDSDTVADLDDLEIDIVRQGTIRICRGRAGTARRWRGFARWSILWADLIGSGLLGGAPAGVATGDARIRPAHSDDDSMRDDSPRGLA